MSQLYRLPLAIAWTLVGIPAMLVALAAIGVWVLWSCARARRDRRDERAAWRRELADMRTNDEMRDRWDRYYRR